MKEKEEIRYWVMLYNKEHEYIGKDRYDYEEEEYAKEVAKKLLGNRHETSVIVYHDTKIYYAEVRRVKTKVVHKFSCDPQSVKFIKEKI